LASAIDDLVAEFNLPRLYEDPVYHVSIAWAEMSCEMGDRFLTSLRDIAGNILNLKLVVKEVKLKMGNEISTVAL
jgi:hypothetical protein